MTPAPSIQSTATRPPTASTFKPRVRRLGAGLYLVESATTPGLGHQATATSCGCRAGQFGKACRHQRLVAALEPRFQAWYGQLEKREQREGQAAPVATAAADRGFLHILYWAATGCTAILPSTC